MNRKLDLNTIQRPVLELTLPDESQTTIHVKTPTMNKFREMQKVAAELENADMSDRDVVDIIYDFLADIMSCNREYITITAEELSGKYNIDLDAALLIYREYLSFLSGIAAEKN